MLPLGVEVVLGEAGLDAASLLLARFFDLLLSPPPPPHDPSLLRLSLSLSLDVLLMH